MVKVTIEGSGLTTPLEITDPKIREFNVWMGPGVYINDVEQTEGFIIDWPRGIVAEPPTGLQHYVVSFYSNRRNAERSIAYIVSYDYDPSVQQGFIRLPGKGDCSYQLNVSTILHGHGYEGNWFHATVAWETLVRPLIERAKAAAR
jgi:hypothetical protein